jgi:hypothetical protein
MTVFAAFNNFLHQGSATFSLPQAALAILIFVEGRRNKLICPRQQVRLCIFNFRRTAGMHLKTGNYCISPYN